MGILGQLREKASATARARVRKVIEKVAATANIPMAVSREEKDRAEIRAAEAQGAPRFGDVGRAGWDLGRDRLARLGQRGVSTLQARWTDSELSVRQELAPWMDAQDGRGGYPRARWSEVGELLLTAWQARGEEAAAAWRKTFDALVAAWEKAGRDHASRVFTDGWRQAAADFDRAWQREWEGLQKELQAIAHRMREAVAQARGLLGDGVPAPLLDAFNKAGITLENTILRAEAELWGVWGTNGARIRGVSRTVTEGRGSAEDAWPGVFDACEADFDTGFRHTLSDFQSSWRSALGALALTA